MKAFIPRMTSLSNFLYIGFRCVELLIELYLFFELKFNSIAHDGNVYPSDSLRARRQALGHASSASGEMRK